MAAKRRKKRPPTASARVDQRKPRLTKEFLADLDWWSEHQPRVHTRLLRIMEGTLSEPFQGIGKPEPLKHAHQGFWSRRLTRSDRIVYRVTDEFVEFSSARFHYSDAT